MSTLPVSKHSSHSSADLTAATTNTDATSDTAQRPRPAEQAPVVKLHRLPSSASSMSQDASQRFGNYVLEERLAVGGMAEVFRARRVGAAGFSRTVVIKRILPNFCQDRAFVEMFIDEANTGAQLRHSNIVAIDDFGEVDGRYFLAMEFIQGVDAARLLQALTADRRSLPWEVAAFIVREVLSALDYAHRKKAPDGGPLNVVHRDVSPHNVLVSTAGEIKLTDFGIARARTRIHQTSAHVVKGKLAYMAPEQARAHALDGRADLFAVGVSAFELLANQRPFVGKNEPEVVTNLLKGRRERLSKLRPDVPAQLERVIDGLLEVDRERRFDSAARALAEIDPLVSPSAGRTLAAIVAHYFFPSTGTSVSAVRAPIGALPGALPPFPMGALAGAPPPSIPAPSIHAPSPPPPRLSRPAPESAPSTHAPSAATQLRSPALDDAPHESSSPAIEQGPDAELSSVASAPTPPPAIEEKTSVSALIAVADAPRTEDRAPVARESTEILRKEVARADRSSATISAAEAAVRPQDAVTRTSMRPALDAPAPIGATDTPPSATEKAEAGSTQLDSMGASARPRAQRPSLALVAAIVALVLVATLVLALLRGAARGSTATVLPAPAVEAAASSSAARALQPSPEPLERSTTPTTPTTPAPAAATSTPQPARTEAAVEDSTQARPTPAAPSPVIASPRRQARRVRAARPAPVSPQPTSRGAGTLAIQASPWGEIQIDGVREGLTPVYRRISAGTHRIVLVHPPSGFRIARSVHVRANEVTRLSVELR